MQIYIVFGIPNKKIIFYSIFPFQHNILTKSRYYYNVNSYDIDIDHIAYHLPDIARRKFFRHPQGDKRVEGTRCASLFS